MALSVAASIAAASSARAQSESSTGDRTAAGEAYDHGTAAYLAHEYARAAGLFETAYRLAPSAPALIQAIRSHEHAGDVLRAGSLALRLLALYGTQRQAEHQAQTTLHAARTRYLRVDVTCDATCTVELDGGLEDYNSFFVDPASAHTVRASFDTGRAEPQTTSGAAGETQALSFARPAPPPPPPVVVAVVEPPHVIEMPAPPPPPPSSGIHPAAFLTVAGLTLASAGVLVWSAVDMYDGVPAYMMSPTDARYQDGHGREIRTDIMYGVTGGLAATAIVLAILTDWNALGGSSSAERARTERRTPTLTAVSPMVSPSGGGLVVQGGF